MENVVSRPAQPIRPVRPWSYLFSGSTIHFSFKKLAHKTADRIGKPKTTAVCSPPPFHRPLKLNPSIMHGYFEYWIRNRVGNLQRRSFETCTRSKLQLPLLKPVISAALPHTVWSGCIRQDKRHFRYSILFKRVHTSTKVHCRKS